MGFPGSSAGKESTCNARDPGLIPGLGRSPGGGHGNPLQYSCLENPHGQKSLVSYSPWSHKESVTTEQLSTHRKCLAWCLVQTEKYWLCLVAQSCPALCDPMDYSRPGSSLYGDSPGKNTGVGCHALPQEIFPTQGSNPSLLHRRQST